MLRNLWRAAHLLLVLVLATALGCEPADGGATGPGDTGDTGAATDDGPPTVETFAGVLPTIDQLEVAIPEVGTSTGALATEADGIGTYQGAAVGVLSEYYEFTLKTTWGVNWFLGSILGPIDWIVDNLEPTLTEENKAVWVGSEPLDPQHHLLVVEKMEDGHYEYIVLARMKSPEDSEWRVRIAGTYTPNGTPEHGQGSVWVDMDTDLYDETAGKVLFLWSHLNDERTVTSYMFDVLTEEDAEPLTAVYHYERYQDHSGLFAFAMDEVDINGGEAGKEALEDAVIISRWDATGAGRADLIATGGDVESEGYEYAVVTQCWAPLSFETAFESVYVSLSGQDVVQATASGDFDACPYEEIGEPTLPEVGEEPEVDELPEEAEEPIE